MKAIYWSVGAVLLLIVVLLSVATDPPAQADEIYSFATATDDTFNVEPYFGFITITASGGAVTYRIFGPTFSSTTAGSLASGETANINLYEAGRTASSFALYPESATARGYAY